MINTNFIESHPNRMSGAACIKGTRFPISQLIQEIADGEFLLDVINDFDLDEKQTVGALKDLSIFLGEYNGLF